MPRKVINDSSFRINDVAFYIGRKSRYNDNTRIISVQFSINLKKDRTTLIAYFKYYSNGFKFYKVKFSKGSPTKTELLRFNNTSLDLLKHEFNKIAKKQFLVDIRDSTKKQVGFNNERVPVIIKLTHKANGARKKLRFHLGNEKYLMEIDKFLIDRAKEF